VPRFSVVLVSALAVALGVITPAGTLHAPRLAQGQASRTACAQQDIGLVSVGRFGEVIEEGAGYGSVRIGDSETTLLLQWGPTTCTDRPAGRDRAYGLWRGTDQAVEILFVRTRAGRVLWMGTMPAPHAGFARAIGVRTRAGVRLETPLGEVERIYGPPEATTRFFVLYRSRGVGFGRYHDQVGAIVIFAPGTTPDLDGTDF
jgi:hypothetical protein